MPNASDAHPLSNNFLIAGPTGSGKTSLFCTIPGKKFMYNFEASTIHTIQGQDIEYESFLSNRADFAASTITRIWPIKRGPTDKSLSKLEPMTYRNFEEHFDEKFAEGFFDQFAAISLEMSGLESICMDRIMFLQGAFGRTPEVTEKVACRELMLKIIMTFCNMPLITYLHAHIDFDKDEKTGKMENILGLIGQLRRQIPMNCSEIWLTGSEPNEEGHPTYFVQTAPDRRTPFLRTSRRMREIIGDFAEVDVTIKDWNKPEAYGLGPLLTKLSSTAA